MRPESHACPTRERDPDAFFAAYDAAKKKYLSALLARLNVDALQAIATRARDGISCSIPSLSQDLSEATRLSTVSRQCGGQNAHVDVVFTDGVTWLARLRLDDPLLPPADVQEKVIESEVATLHFLAKTKVPAPHVYAYASTAANPVGTPYILMEKLPGTPLDWPSTSPAQQKHVLEQLVDIYLELEKHPLPQTGCLMFSKDKKDVHVGSFVQAPNIVTPSSTLGPFRTLTAAYMSILGHQMAMLANGEYGALRVDNYLSFLWRKQALAQLIDDEHSNNGPFYLKHYDDKGDHLLVDADFNITGVIDWEWASVEAKPYAFGSPCMLWPVGEFYEGSNILAANETLFAELMSSRGGRDDLATLVRDGRPWQRYLFFLGGGLPSTLDEFEPLFRGLQNAFSGGGKEIKVPYRYAEWKSQVIDNFIKEDPDFATLVSKAGEE
ncbi:hypothetical protein SPBR_05934 [Sporothrix brasiliensis 5110]|uniref:Aminoglycoside phosphotransferase domain-containing protein n=1 Tax=Sporothrix brasiliensis 5110 TaxID=1398154 RepID=A0A0C2IZN6_9PEZI|nr:uncharacterized protein SPBR_05934 [Sporothrix brasiliensis 5110]KIH94566.1 hypothetical protein SPBR_05934 [Sporothrix brasiliensis 5110]